jgi:hypothetical protein
MFCRSGAHRQYRPGVQHQEKCTNGSPEPAFGTKLIAIDVCFPGEFAGGDMNVYGAAHD